MGVAHTRVTLIGTLGHGIAPWNCSFATAPMIGANYGDLLAAARDAFSAFDDALTVSELDTHWTSATSFTGAKVTALDAAGHTTLSAEFIAPLPHPGTALGACMPPEVAIVASLRTDAPGPRGRGRMYLPPSRTADLTVDGGVTADHAGVVLECMQAFFNTWNANPDVLRASVASNAGVFVSAITSVRVGNVYDSQRRRRFSIHEGYVSADLVP